MICGHRRFAPTFVAAVIVTVAACATPTERVNRVSEAAGFERKTVAGDPFEHLILIHNTDGASGADLHVYIEGDGSPWIAGRWAATDPTPQTPVMLRLMQLDPGPALYLGRHVTLDCSGVANPRIGPMVDIRRLYCAPCQSRCIPL